MTDSAAKKAQNEELPRGLLNKGFGRSGAVMFPSQITPEKVEESKTNIENVLRPKGDVDDTVFRAGVSGVLEATESVINTAGYWHSFIQGEEYQKKDLFDL